MSSHIRTIVFEDSRWREFLPVAYMRSVPQLVCGMYDLITRVRTLVNDGGGDVELWCRSEISEVVGRTAGVPVNRTIEHEADGVLFLNGRGIWPRLPAVSTGEGSWIATSAAADGREEILAIYADTSLASKLSPESLLDEKAVPLPVRELPHRGLGDSVRLARGAWELSLLSGALIATDWMRFSERGGLHSAVDAGSHILAPENVFIGEGTRIKPCVVIDAEEGPVYIGKGVRIMPHTTIQGPVYIGDNVLVQAGATIRDGSYIGPMCKVGGEIDASVFHSHSNKQHDGFLGHSYVGSWVNIAADCINSDLKNTYGTVRVNSGDGEIDTGEMFVGAVIGDHSKLGINVAIPTGASVGFCSSVFVDRCPKTVGDFRWITENGDERYDPARALAVAKKVVARRNVEMSPQEEELFLSVAMKF